MTAAKTDSEFRAELAQANPYVTLIETYVNNYTKVLVRDTECGHEWRSVPYTLLNGTRCPDCRAKRSARSRRKSPEQFVAELAQINPDIEVLEEYAGVRTKILVCCKKCGHAWRTTPMSLLRSGGCGKCSRRKSHEQFVAELAIRKPGIEIVGQYVTASTKIAFRCRTCGCEWMASPGHVLAQTNCPRCTKERRARKPASENA